MEGLTHKEHHSAQPDCDASIRFEVDKMSGMPRLSTLPLILSLLFFSFLMQGQDVSVKGRILDAETGFPLENANISAQGTRLGVVSNASGSFLLEKVPPGTEAVVISAADHAPLVVSIGGRSGLIDLGIVKLEPQLDGSALSAEELIPTISISESDLSSDNAGGAQNISGLLSASRDVFVSAAAFTFGPRRFRIRGYDSENTAVLINGVPMNDLEVGRPFWGSWGGLNDVFRNRDNSVGLGASPLAFGGIGGVSTIDARASGQRRQTRISYSNSNRSYRNRIMATHATGMQRNGWAFALSASRRWADEGYVPGTDYDAWSYFLGIERKLNEVHSLNLTVFGAPNRRGRSIAATQEWYDIAGTNFYNPWWGYQAGQKRNSRIATTHQPIIMLTHYWDMPGKATLQTSASYKFGRNGSTALDWYDAPDPRPEYYRKAPSYLGLAFGDELATNALEYYQGSEAARQIDWDVMFRVNRSGVDTVFNADGIPGNTLAGYRANYLVEERRYDSKEFNLNAIYENPVSDNLTLQGGASYQYYRGNNYKLVNDLLGADYSVDIDRFAERDSSRVGNNEFYQNDLETPNRIIREGDRWGYDYNSTIHKGAAWGQANFSYRKVDFFMSGEFSVTSFWRTGNVRNGRFPDNSLGDSEKSNFANFGVKGGVTYKLDGRNYLFFNGAYMTRAPYFRNSFVSPRARNQLVPGLTDEKITSIEGGYILRSPYLKARAVGYYSRFADRFLNRSFFLDNALNDGTTGGFVNYIMTGVDTRHMGIELAGEVQLGAGLSVLAAAAIGEYVYESRPEVSVYLDNSPQELLQDKTAYIKNFYIPGTPQSAYTVGLNYRSAKFWFLNINVNYLNRLFMDFFPERRTLEAISYRPDPEYQTDLIDRESDLYKDIIYQEEVEGGVTVDLFGGKSWKFGDRFLYLTVGINNVLDNQNIITGGFEQFRFDFEGKELGLFPNRYFYGFGINYFAQLALRF